MASESPCCVPTFISARVDAGWACVRRAGSAATSGVARKCRRSMFPSREYGTTTEGTDTNGGHSFFLVKKRKIRDFRLCRDLRGGALMPQFTGLYRDPTE